MRVKRVTKRQAQRVRALIIAHFPAFTDEGRNLPVLHEPDTGWGDHWVLSWEGGAPYEWPVLASIGGVEEYTRARYEPVRWPNGVFGEAINVVDLGIYPQ